MTYECKKQALVQGLRKIADKVYGEEAQKKIDARKARKIAGRNGEAKYTFEFVCAIREEAKTLSYRQLALKHNLSEHTIINWVQGITRARK
jgi:hypothetical protein